MIVWSLRPTKVVSTIVTLTSCYWLIKYKRGQERQRKRKKYSQGKGNLKNYCTLFSNVMQCTACMVYNQYL